MRHRAASWSRAVVRTSASRAALGGKDDRGIRLTRVGPGGGASLGVKVHNERRVPGELGDNGQERQGRFPHAAFLRDDGYGQHAGMVTC